MATKGSRQRAQERAPSFLQGLGGLWDMGAGALRGATSATLGLPGDLESLVRLLAGGENTLPTTESVSAALPALKGVSIPAGQNPYQGVGEFLPLVPPKAAASAGRAVKQGALAALRNATAPVERMPLQAQRGAVRMKGGNFNDVRLAGYLGDALNIQTPEYADLMGDFTRAPRGNQAVQDWGAKQLKNYLRKDLGSPTDPLLQVEKEFPNLHLPEDMLRDPEEALRQRRMFSHDANSRVGAYMRNHNELSGGQPLTPWGLHSDDAMRFTDPSGYATDLLGGELPEDEALEMLSELGDKYKWLQDAPPDTKIWGLVDPDDLGFNHVLDYLEAATKADEYVKRAGPDTLALLRQGLAGDWGDKIRLYDAGLALDSKSLERLSVADAVRKTAQWNELLANAGVAGDPDLARGIARVHKEYPGDGMKWVELGTGDKLPEGVELDASPMSDMHRVKGQGQWYKTPEDAIRRYATDELSAGLNAEGKAMGHCVGGYCDEVAERGTKIYSLRDAKGNPHVTVEVRPGRNDFPTTDYAWAREYGDDLLKIDEHARGPERDPELSREANRRRSAQLLFPERFAAEPPPEVVQIKGKQNAAPVEKYLPYVQDFVKSGQWGRVGDLRNTGLRQIGSKYFSDGELRAAYDQAGFQIPYDALGMDYFDALATNKGMNADDADRKFMELIGLPLPRNYASGGSVTPLSPRERLRARLKEIA